MLKLTRKDEERTAIQKEIDNVIESMSSLDPTCELYKKQIEVLESLIELDKKQNPKKKISPDTIAVIAGNLLGIGLILVFEEKHVITSKALGFVLKGRV